MTTVELWRQLLFSLGLAGAITGFWFALSYWAFLAPKDDKYKVEKSIAAFIVGLLCLSPGAYAMQCAT